MKILYFLMQQLCLKTPIFITRNKNISNRCLAGNPTIIQACWPKWLMLVVWMQLCRTGAREGHPSIPIHSIILLLYKHKQCTLNKHILYSRLRIHFLSLYKLAAVCPFKGTVSRELVFLYSYSNSFSEWIGQPLKVILYKFFIEPNLRVFFYKPPCFIT